MDRFKSPHATASAQNHDIIVIGGSAGTVEVLIALLKALPDNLPAALFIATHLSPDNPSLLPDILSRIGTLPAAAAVDGEAIEAGRAYVASPDRHMLVGNGVVRLSRAARENGHRPAVDPLFRSAAASYGPRVIGVVLSGNLDDGSAGMLEIRKAGGITVVQEPAEARYPDMPRNANDALGGADHVVGVSGLGELLQRLVNEPAAGARAAAEGIANPEVLLAETLLAAQAEGIEEALWSALRALAESSSHARGLARRMAGRGLKASADRFARQADEADRRMQLIRAELLQSGPGIGPGATGEVDEAAEAATRYAEG